MWERRTKERERTIASRRTIGNYVAGVQRWASKKGFMTEIDENDGS